MAKVTLASEAAEDGSGVWGWGDGSWGGSDGGGAGGGGAGSAGGVTLVEGCTFTGEVDELRAEGYLLPDKARQELEHVGGVGKGKINLEGSHKVRVVVVVVIVVVVVVGLGGRLTPHTTCKFIYTPHFG